MSGESCPFYEPLNGDYAVREATAEDRRRLSPPPGPSIWDPRNIWRRYALPPRQIDALYRKYGPTFTLRLPWSASFFSRDADICAEVRLEEGRLFHQGAGSLPSPAFPTGFVQQVHAEKHVRLQKNLLKALRSTPYEPVLTEEVLALRARWQVGDVLDMHPMVMGLMSSCISAVMFGRGVATPEMGIRLRTAAMWALLAHMLPGTSLLKRLPFKPLRNAERTFGECRELIMRGIEAARGAPRPGSTLLAGMVHASEHGEDDERLGDEEIRDNAATLLALLGPPTFSATWAVWLLSRHEEVRRKVEAEVDEVLGDRPIAVDDFERLPYTQAVFLEVLRLHPPGQCLNKSVQRDIVAGKYLIPKGTKFFVTLDSQRDPELFDDPGRFLPERWLDGLLESLPSHAYTPFGYGYRVCPATDFGLRMVVAFLASTAQHWRLEPLSTKVRPYVKPLIPWQIRGGLKVRVVSRK
jgi:pentalenene oxygenase